MAGTVKTNEVKLVSPNGLTEKSITMDNSGVVYVDGKEKANVQQENWISPTLLNGWVNYGSGLGENARYFKDTLGFVHIKGMLKNGTVPSAVFTLPVGYRPFTLIRFSIVSNGAFAHLTIKGDGNVEISSGSNAWIDFAEIIFKPEQ